MTPISNSDRSPSGTDRHRHTTAFDEHIRRMRSFRESHPRCRDTAAVIFTRLKVLHPAIPYREKGGFSAPRNNLKMLIPVSEVILAKGTPN